MRLIVKHAFTGLVSVALMLMTAAAIVGELAAGVDSREASELRLARPTTFTREQAQTSALAVVSGSVHTIELEREHGKIAYEVRIRPQAGGKDIEVLVDAATGEVLK